VETIRYYNYDGIITIAPKPLHIHRNLLGGIFSHMVDKKSGGDKEKMVKVERYRYSIRELSIEI
jgi:hypothetical protein